MRRTFAQAFGWLMVATVVVAHGQAAPPPQTSVPPVSVQGPASPMPQALALVGDYKLGPGDVIEVDVLTQVLKATVPDGQYHIGADGAIVFPGIKDPVKVQGLTCRDLEQKLKKVLAEANVFVGAQLRVTITSFASQVVTFLGQGVRSVGPVTLHGGDVSLTAGLAQAGLLPEAANTIKIVHADKTEMIVDRAELDRGNPAADPILQDGDRIIVDKAGVVYLEGEGVVHQGVFKWEPGLTVDQAVQRSGGYTKIAAKGSVTVRWLDAKGKPQHKDLKETEIYTYVLKENDYVTVPKKKM